MLLSPSLLFISKLQISFIQGEGSLWAHTELVTPPPIGFVGLFNYTTS